MGAALDLSLLIVNNVNRESLFFVRYSLVKEKYLSVVLNSYQEVAPQLWVDWVNQYHKLISDFCVIDKTKMEWEVNWSIGNEKVHRSAISDMQWEKIANSDREIHNLSIYSTVQNWDGYGSEFYYTARGSSVHTNNGLRVTGFSCVVEQRVFGNKIHRDLQERFVDLSCLFFKKINGVTGYITTDYGHASSSSPYEIVFRVMYSDVAEFFDTRVRGYYWGNFLHQSHLNIIGERALSKVPPQWIHWLDDERHYWQITDNINELTLEHLHNLREIFSPVLPPPHPLAPPLEDHPFML